MLKQNNELYCNMNSGISHQQTDEQGCEHNICRNNIIIIIDNVSFVNKFNYVASVTTAHLKHYTSNFGDIVRVTKNVEFLPLF